MNDPWDVKSVRKPGQYLSCMKINGVPLLPPVLSKDCRKEMQYYKVLAQEVENRITLLRSITDGDRESPEDLTDATELPESDIYEISKDDISNGFQVNIDKIRAVNEHFKEKVNFYTDTELKDKKNTISSNITVITPPLSPILNSPKLIIDLSLNINENGKDMLDSVSKSSSPTPQSEIPERDYNNLTKPKEILYETETVKKRDQNIRPSNKLKSFVHRVEPLADIPLKSDGPSSLSSKSFTGSLNDIHTDSLKESKPYTKLVRQRSYTVLEPSPQLLDYLENQCLSTGVDVTSISMSESRSNLSSPSRKRRSWDLETAKVKWSNMAQELKQKNLENQRPPFRNHISRSTCHKPKPSATKSLVQERPRRGSLSLRYPQKSEPIQKTQRNSTSPVRDNTLNTSSAKNLATPKNFTQRKDIPKQTVSPQLSNLVIPDGEDPATKVRELYEKIQKQQFMQMANLVEKQKREQLLLQQAFEEQNKILYKQLKTIVPKSPVEAKEAWVDKVQETSDRGPVSLSQLINCQSEKPHSPVSTTLTDSKNYINKCNNVLKRSRHITGSLKKCDSPCQVNLNSQPKLEGSLTRTHSPTQKNASRKLVYESNTSSPTASDREYEQMPTDRTNDTLADLNVTFNTDTTSYSDGRDCDIQSQLVHDNDVTVIHKNPSSPASVKEAILRNMELSMYNISMRRKFGSEREATAKERAASCVIVAYAKGFLTRRLMRTERVQGIVQTIRDALLCALQLHQEREGIRGADVDLHRRLIQQITAACYSLHDAFISSSPAERCAIIAADRLRKRTLAIKPPSVVKYKPTRDIMSLSHSGSFPTRSKRPAAVCSMTQSHYETYNPDKGLPRRYMPSPRRRPWR